MDYFLTYIVKINFLKMHLSDSWARFIYICGLFLNHRCLRNNEFDRHSSADASRLDYALQSVYTPRGM